MSDKPHLGGAHVEGDPATIMPDVWGYLLVKYELKSVIDVGAGGGHALKWFEDNGLCSIQGVEGYADYVKQSPVKDHLLLHDFTDGPAPIARPFDLVWCAEFLEHVEERFMANYMHTFRLARWLCVTHAEPGQGGHHHVNCLLPGTQVAASGIQNATRRSYCGQAITIRTARGHELSVTPNHPILTTAGWVGANQLSVGMDVISSSLRNGVVSNVVPDKNERPSMIEEIFASLKKKPEARRVLVPITAKDFHGDGANGEVEIVRADRHLLSKDRTARKQPCSELVLQRRNTMFLCGIGGRPASATEGVVLSCLQTPPHQSSFLVGKFGNPFQLRHGMTDGKPRFGHFARHNLLAHSKLGRDLIHEQTRFIKTKELLPIETDAGHFHSRYTVPNFHPSVDETASDCANIHAMRSGEEIQTFAGRVCPDKIVGIEIGTFHGHVFNLETDVGWYSAGGIITHNCQDDTYWIAKFAEFGFRHDMDETLKLRRTDQRRDNSYGRRTLMFFHRV